MAETRKDLVSTRWKVRTDFQKLSSDLFVCAVAHRPFPLNKQIKKYKIICAVKS